MSKRKAAAPATPASKAPKVTINQFFFKVEGPTSVPPEADAWLEPEKPWSRPTLRLKTGELRAKCDHKSCHLPLSLPHFKPKQNPRYKADFEAAYVKYEAARQARNAAEMDEARTELERL